MQLNYVKFDIRVEKNILKLIYGFETNIMD